MFKLETTMVFFNRRMDKQAVEYPNNDNIQWQKEMSYEVVKGLEKT